jgi:hypothetical protein
MNQLVSLWPFGVIVLILGAVYVFLQRKSTPAPVAFPAPKPESKVPSVEDKPKPAPTENVKEPVVVKSVDTSVPDAKPEVMDVKVEMPVDKKIVTDTLDNESTQHKTAAAIKQTEVDNHLKVASHLDLASKEMKDANQ